MWDLVTGEGKMLFFFLLIKYVYFLLSSFAAFSYGSWLDNCFQKCSLDFYWQKGNWSTQIVSICFTFGDGFRLSVRFRIWLTFVFITLFSVFNEVVGHWREKKIDRAKCLCQYSVYQKLPGLHVWSVYRLDCAKFSSIRSPTETLENSRVEVFRARFGHALRDARYFRRIIKDTEASRSSELLIRTLIYG